MRAILQRVSQANVVVDTKVAGQIEDGLLVYLGVAKEDEIKDAEFIARKIAGLRVFEDANDKINLSVKDIGGKVLLVSNFTIEADCRKGRRPSFDRAAHPVLAEELYEKVGELIAAEGMLVEYGVFGAKMIVNSVGTGPVNLIVSSR